MENFKFFGVDAESDDVIHGFTNLGKYVVFTNPEKEQVRVAFPDKMLVVKLFDATQQETFSVKLWEGDFDTIVSYWNTKPTDEPLTDDMKLKLRASLEWYKKQAIKLFG